MNVLPRGIRAGGWGGSKAGNGGNGGVTSLSLNAIVIELEILDVKGVDVSSEYCVVMWGYDADRRELSIFLGYIFVLSQLHIYQVGCIRLM